MNSKVSFKLATQVLASLDIQRSVRFYCDALGFQPVHVEQGVYGIVSNADVVIHFWFCTDRHIAENTSCRVRVEGINHLYQSCSTLGIVHPNAPLKETPWGTREFAILDPDGNLVTFTENVDASEETRLPLQAKSIT